MSIYCIVTKQDLINSRKLAEQLQKQHALKNKKRILKQTHDKRLAESLSPVTRKLDEVNESSKLFGEVTKESDGNINFFLNSSNSSKAIREMLGSLMNKRSFFKKNSRCVWSSNYSRYSNSNIWR